MTPFTDDEIRRHVISAIEETINIFGETADIETAHRHIKARINRRMDALKLAAHACLEREIRHEREIRPACGEKAQ